MRLVGLTIVFQMHFEGTLFAVYPSICIIFRLSVCVSVCLRAHAQTRTRGGGGATHTAQREIEREREGKSRVFSSCLSLAERVTDSIERSACPLGGWIWSISLTLLSK